MAYEFTSRVRYSETGRDEKLTLVSMIDYFQDTSTFQTEDCGSGLNYLYDRGVAWMILSWQVEIVRRPGLGERIAVQTIPYEFKMFYGYRNYALLDEKRNYLAKANSVWALIDLATGKPIRVWPEYVVGYEMGNRLDMEYRSRKLKVPEDGVPQQAFPVCGHHLDTNNHVNNGQYIAMAEEYLPAGFETRRLTVEYRRQARLHDMIVPYIHQDGHQITVSLCDEEGKAYAVVVHEGEVQREG